MFKKFEPIKFLFLPIFLLVTFASIPKAYSQSKKPINTDSYENGKNYETEGS